MKRQYYSSKIEDFIVEPSTSILGQLVANNDFPLEQSQRDSWIAEIELLQENLKGFGGKIYFEYSIPRMGKRVDVLLIVGSVIFVLEFKVGERTFPNYAIDQVWDYALDLKNFHETSHDKWIAPLLICTHASNSNSLITLTPKSDQVFDPILINESMIAEVIDNVLRFCDGSPIDYSEWEEGRYRPTPTIIEAAMQLYKRHSVDEISRKDASAKNLSATSKALSCIIQESKQLNRKSICFVTGVPGAGKTLVGLNIATQNIDDRQGIFSVFLSGNGPLVAVLREALARDRVAHTKLKKEKLRLSEARRDVKAFIQNVHSFRDECLIDPNPPREHVALFDEAQRAWNLAQTSKFMKTRKHVANFDISEPEFLISCMNRHADWAVVVCLVGGGQEINTGEAGIGEWIDAINRSYPDWTIWVSPNLSDSEYKADEYIKSIDAKIRVCTDPDLHLSVSMRSFRSELVSLLVKQILDLSIDDARTTLGKISPKYPIVITRSLEKAKSWLRVHARGSERYGMMVSSEALRLKPLAIDTRVATDPIHWFLDSKEDIRSSYYLEDVATEFQIQGLELDWGCVIWDGDFRYSKKGWESYSFCGSRWTKIRKAERQMYLKNAYRVLLTRARQGMVIVVPEGHAEDPTRDSNYYDPVFEYLVQIGFEVI